jgi:hypothetical protein
MNAISSRSEAPVTHLVVNREAWQAFLGIVKGCDPTTRCEPNA